MGKRSGDGFVVHKARLTNALSRALAERLMLMDFTIGRKGFAGYIKALAGSNIVKIVPTSNGSASDEQASAKRLKVVCGSNTSFLDDMAWIGEKTSMSFAEIRISPNKTITPNIGSLELSEALNRILPFTATKDNRPVLQNVLFVAGEGKLKMVSADGFRLAIVNLDYEGEGKVLIPRDELKGIANALRKAKRVRLGFEKQDESLEGMNLIIDTEAIRYKWRGADGQFPDYEKLIPTEFNTIAHLDTVEAIKTVYAFKALSGNPKEYPVDLTIGEGTIIMANPDEKGEAVISAETDGQGYVRIDGKYLADVLKACGGMVDFQLTNSYSPMLFTTDGYQVVVMPVMSNRANEQQRADREGKEAEATIEPTEAELEAEPTEAELEAEPTSELEAEPTEAELEAIDAEGEAEAEAKPKGKRSRKRDKVTVA